MFTRGSATAHDDPRMAVMHPLTLSKAGPSRTTRPATSAATWWGRARLMRSDPELDPFTVQSYRSTVASGFDGLESMVTVPPTA